MAAATPSAKRLAAGETSPPEVNRALLASLSRDAKKRGKTPAFPLVRVRAEDRPSGSGGERVFRLLGEGRETILVVEGNIREHLAIDLDPGLLEAVDQATV